MTFIQPSKNHSIINRILIALVVCLVLSIFWLVSLYNSSLNLSYGLSEMRSELKAVQTTNAALKEKLFVLVDPASFKNFAGSKNLVQDKKLQYLEIHSQWSYASEY